MQNIIPIPWGAQDRFQAHFIVKGNVNQSDSDFLAETKLKTQGHFGSKKVVGVEWIGGKIVGVLNKDDELSEMIKKLSYRDACIWVDPTKNGVRIHGKWKTVTSWEFQKNNLRFMTGSHHILKKIFKLATNLTLNNQLFFPLLELLR